MEKEIQIPDGFEVKIEGNKVVFVPKEREDERIRNEILLYIGSKQDIDLDTHNRWCAYLERQKDSDKAMSAIEKIDKYIDSHTANAHDMDDSNPDKKYYSGVDDTLSDIAGILTDSYANFDGKKWIREKDYHDQLDAQYAQGFEDGRKEQKPAEWSEEEKARIERIVDVLDWAEEKGRISYSDWEDYVGYVKSLKPWPKQEWSEEDEKILNDIKFSFEFNQENMTPSLIEQYEKFFNKIKSIKPKQEWSEEDRQNIEKLIEILPQCIFRRPHIIDRDECRDLISWLKSLRPQSHWKPSEEQMNALKSYAEDSACLDELYDDLKKL